MSNKPERAEKNIVLVTGGAGYGGSILIRLLIQNGYRVVCLDNLRYGGRSLIEVWDNRAFEFSKTDITDYEAVDQILEKYDYLAVIHLAAIVGDPACKLEPELAVRTNRDASIHLLNKAHQSKVHRFIFASTCSNYGKMVDSTGMVDETAPLAPVSLYAALKVEFESQLLHRDGKVDGFCPTALRFATVYGLSPRMRFDLTVNEFTKELAQGRELVVFGEQFWRPYCHVSDYARAILTVLNAAEDQVAFAVYNVGDTAQNFTKKMIVDELLGQIPDGKVRFVSKEEDPRDYRVNFEKIKNTLGFNISRTVPEGIRDILTSIRAGIIENPDDQRYYNTPILR
jgi:nucleoside-diphosphate-sugar epimerase